MSEHTSEDAPPMHQCICSGCGRRVITRNEPLPDGWEFIQGKAYCRQCYILGGLLA